MQAAPQLTAALRSPRDPAPAPPPAWLRSARAWPRRYPHTNLPVVPWAHYELVTAPVPFLLGVPGRACIQEFEE